MIVNKAHNMCDNNLVCCVVGYDCELCYEAIPDVAVLYVHLEFVRVILLRQCR